MKYCNSVVFLFTSPSYPDSLQTPWSVPAAVPLWTTSSHISSKKLPTKVNVRPETILVWRKYFREEVARRQSELSGERLFGGGGQNETRDPATNVTNCETNCEL